MWFVLSPVLKTEGYPISGSELSVKQRQRTPQQSCGASKALPHQDRNRSADISLRHISCTYPRCRAAGYHDEMSMVVLESGSGQYPKGLVPILEVSFKRSEP